ncbi:hypothetical protein FRC10_001554 [Ceratobasidium sp. 414]|nr:hypothetical protein FRC10_001554 [Ceratobasidium sp. 414]
MALVFIAGPLSGLIMQPLIGKSPPNSLSWRKFTAPISLVQAVDRALLVDILPPSLQAAGNAWAGRMFGLGSVAGFFIGGVNLPQVIPWLGRTQLEVLSIVSSALLLGLHGVTAGAVEEKVLVTDGSASEGNVFVRIFKDIWDNILTLPRTIRSICMVQFLCVPVYPLSKLIPIAWFPVLFYSSTWVGDIYKVAQIANGRANNDSTLQDEATRAASLALLYSSILSFAVSIVAPFFIRPSGGDTDEKRGLLGRFKISLAGLWSASQAIFACAMMATLLPQTVATATVIVTLTGFCWAVTQWAPFSLLGEAILVSSPDYSAVPAHELEEIPMIDHRSRPRSTSSSPPRRRSPSLSPTPKRGSPSGSPRQRRSLSPASSTSSVHGGGSTPASALFSNDAARLSRPSLGKRTSGVGVRNGTDDDFQRVLSEGLDETREDGVLEAAGGTVPVDEGIGSKAGIILFLVTGLSAVLFALLEPHRNVLQGNHNATVPPGTNVTLPLMVREEVEDDASPDSIGLIFRIGGLGALRESYDEVLTKLWIYDTLCLFLCSPYRHPFFNLRPTQPFSFLLPPQPENLIMDIGITSSIQNTVAYLRTLPSIRERCSRVHALAQVGKLEYFDYHPEKENDVVKFCAGIIERDFGSAYDTIPPHSRWRHFDAGRERIAPLLAQWSKELPPLDAAKRLIDLFLVSVLLDAGAGNAWAYTESGGAKFGRSEGLAIASLDMFLSGFFASDGGLKVDAAGLKRITPESTGTAMQVSASNPMSGLEGRSNLLANLGNALSASPEMFGAEGRPGNMLAEINPVQDSPGSNLVPFHKLSQWLAYSLVEPIEKVLGWKVEGMEDMTGLPEYRNGGLLVDFGVLTLRKSTVSSFYPDPKVDIARLAPSHPAIIEWRAMTVVELYVHRLTLKPEKLRVLITLSRDRIAAALRKYLNAPNLALAQVLESATWKGGREIAKQKRPETEGPPIEIESDGTVF